MSDDDDISPLVPVFAVPLLNEDEMDLSNPPRTGIEYLQQSKYKEKQLSSVVVSEKWQNKTGTNNITVSESCSYNLIISKKVQNSLIADFSQMRLIISRYMRKYVDNDIYLQSQPILPDNEKDWFDFLFGSNTSEDNYATTKPLLSILTAISQPMIWKLFKYFLLWLQKGDTDIMSCSSWLYGLLACLEMPIVGNVIHSLRELARYYISIHKTNDSICKDELCAISVIVTLIARYFRQFDLIENYRSI